MQPMYCILFYLFLNNDSCTHGNDINRSLAFTFHSCSEYRFYFYYYIIIIFIVIAIFIITIIAIIIIIFIIIIIIVIIIIIIIIILLQQLPSSYFVASVDQWLTSCKCEVR